LNILPTNVYIWSIIKLWQRGAHILPTPILL
jgi:hypothetical protein